MGFDEKLLLSFLTRKPGLKYKVTPELLKIADLPIANACNSEHLLPDANATKKSVFFASDLIGADCNGSNGGSFRNFRTVGRSQAGQTWRILGRVISIPSIRNLIAVLSFSEPPLRHPVWNDLIAFKYPVTVLDCRPTSNLSLRKSVISFTLAVSGSTFLSLHHLMKCLARVE